MNEINWISLYVALMLIIIILEYLFWLNQFFSYFDAHFSFGLILFYMGNSYYFY